MGDEIRVERVAFSGFAFTALVVERMRSLVRAALLDEDVHQLAREVTADLPARDVAAESAAVLSWVQRNRKYTALPSHPETFQRLQTFRHTVWESPSRRATGRMNGECASLTVVGVALSMALGHDVRFRTAGTDPGDPLGFEHVLYATRVGAEWVASDPSYDEAWGWEHPAGVVRRDWWL